MPSDIDKLSSLLGKLGLHYAIPMERGLDRDNRYQVVVPGERVAEKSWRGKLTSQRQLSYARRAIQDKLGISVEWVIQPSATAADLEAELHSVVDVRLGGMISNTFLSWEGEAPGRVWYELSPGVSPEVVLDSLIMLTRMIFNARGYSAPQVIVDDLSTGPRDSQILKTVKQLAPVLPRVVASALSEETPQNTRGEEWFERRLDLLRKKGLVVWVGSMGYVLSLLGLTVAPHSHDRDSTDVRRVLVLGRRKW